MSLQTKQLVTSLAPSAQRPDPALIAAWANAPLDATITRALGHFLMTKASHNTRIAYARDILEFIQHCESQKSLVTVVNDVTEKLILLWKDSLNKKHSKYDDSRRRIANSSVARKLCSLASFLDFAVKRNLITASPFEHITRPKVRRQSHARILTEQEIRTLLDVSYAKLTSLRASESMDNPKSAAQRQQAEMEWCILVLLFTVGMRVSELCALRLNDISREGDLLRLHLLTKGGLQHNPLIHPDTAAVLLNYIAITHEQSASTDPLFPSNRRTDKSQKVTHLHRSSVFRIVQKAALSAGITHPFSPHGCRATLATQLHLNEVPVVEIQSLLNHAQVTTTQLYLHRVHELQEAVALNLPWSSNSKSRPLKSTTE